MAVVFLFLEIFTNSSWDKKGSISWSVAKAVSIHAPSSGLSPSSLLTHPAHSHTVPKLLWGCTGPNTDAPVGKSSSRHSTLAEWGWFSSSVMCWFYQQAFWRKECLIWRLTVSVVCAQRSGIHLQCRIRGRRGFDPWVGKAPQRRKWQPNQYSRWEKSHG